MFCLRDDSQLTVIRRPKTITRNSGYAQTQRTFRNSGLKKPSSRCFEVWRWSSNYLWGAELAFWGSCSCLEVRSFPPKPFVCLYFFSLPFVSHCIEGRVFSQEVIDLDILLFWVRLRPCFGKLNLNVIFFKAWFFPLTFPFDPQFPFGVFWFWMPQR